jgi:iron complex transport system substrate-binding protein
MGRIILAVFFGVSACSNQANLTPQKSMHPTIVSLNPCSDAVLAEVADPTQILAISHFSHNANSSSMDLATARKFKAVSASGEEVLPLKPDLVIADPFLPPATAAMLQSLNIPVARLPIASTVEESKAQVMQLATLAGHPDRGRALVARIDAALAVAVPPAGASPISAVVWQSGGIVPGDGSLIGDLLRRTGFRNLSAARGLQQADLLPLENMLADPPQVILAVGNPLSNEDRQLSHPALATLRNARRERLDSSLLWCGGPTIVKAVMRLVEIRQNVPLPLAGGARGGPVLPSAIPTDPTPPASGRGA